MITRIMDDRFGGELEFRHNDTTDAEANIFIERKGDGCDEDSEMMSLTPEEAEKLKNFLFFVL